jgi:UDP-N-acetylglucosamine transferase subunit ALG13
MKPSSHSRRRIFELLRAYHQSRENIRLLINMSAMSDYEKVGFIDAWQEEMADFFAENGYCFACNRLLDRCQCEEPLRRQAPRTA